MNMNKIKLFLVLPMILIGSIFVNMSGVKAVADDGDGSGYAMCYYEWKEEQSSTNAINAATTYRPYKLGIAVYKTGNKKENFKGWATVGCGKREGTGYDGAYEYSDTSGQTCNIDNYSDIFYNMKTYATTFTNGATNNYSNFSNVTWKCPDKVYIEKEKYNDNMKFHLVKGSGLWREVSLTNSNISQSGKPSDLNVGDMSGSKININTGSSISEVDGGKTGDPSSIKDWADNYSSQSGTEVNGCNIISNSLKKELKKWMIILMVVGVGLLLFITMFDLVRALISSDENRLSKVLNSLKIRIICTVALLLLPVIVTGIINLVNKASSEGLIGSNNPLCDIDK
jgi:hypothetical protein